MDAMEHVRSCEPVETRDVLTFEELLAGIFLEERLVADRAVKVVDH